MTVFKPVSTKVEFPRLEEEVLGFWREQEVFAKTEKEREGAPLFKLYEGPPTANGNPGIHHVLARVFKDIIPRYKVMQGFRAPRKGGWDTHGLPVELEVEKELGISSKPQIESYGIDRFNQRCKESVMRYVKEWEGMTDRIGFWIDMKKAYVTYDNSYIESCWWIIKQLWDKKLVYSGYKVAPHCPRCVTTLSSHEVALGYEENTADPSVYVKFKVDLKETLNLAEELPNGQRATLESIVAKLKALKKPAYLLAWTTTPWTLPGNTAVAINPDSEYSLVQVENGDLLILASALLGKALTGDYTVVDRFSGEQLKGLKYTPLYDPYKANLPYGSVVRLDPYGVQELPVAGLEMGQPKPVLDYKHMHESSWQVHTADFVSMEEGTGIVHIAPAFGQEDYDLGKKGRLLSVKQVDLQGNIIGNYPFAGRFVKDADKEIMADLEQRGLLYRHDTYYHTYPFCWRCRTPLLYYAKPSWYIRTTAVKERLLSANQEINWHPDYIKEGRFGEWLRGNVDWAISRERFWGTPLPIWACTKCGSPRCIGSVEELERAAKEPLEGIGPIDLHRPWVDKVVLQCEKCASDMRRIPEVIDVWFDSGAMPLAQYHYPFEPIPGNGAYPGDYICEAVDQTRGWFYSLHAIATLLEYATEGKIKAPSYKNVICLGLILDEKGEKMSKSRGNVVDPWSVINTQGADALRWYLFTAAPPGNSRRFSQELVGEVVRRFVLTLWNTYNFFVTYANIDGFNPRSSPRPPLTSDLDQWIMSELHLLIKDVTDHLEGYNPTDAGRRMEEFVDMLSNWYVRRSRRRFWKSESDADKLSAYHSLYTCLTNLALLLAPFMPFLAEKMYQNLVRSVDPHAPESVHLASWPSVDQALIDSSLSNVTRLAMKVASLGRAARSKAKVKVRQPLAAVLVKPRVEEKALLSLTEPQILDELNVKELRLLHDEKEVLDFGVTLNVALLGPKYGPRLAQLRKALSEADRNTIAQEVLAGLKVTVGPFELSPEELSVTSTDKPGYSVVSEGGYTVAVATSITPELVQEGLARELVHRIQNMRHSAGFEIADRIVTYYRGPEKIQEVMARFATYIQQETLSQRLIEGAPDSGAYAETHQMEGVKVSLAVRKV